MAMLSCPCASFPHVPFHVLPHRFLHVLLFNAERAWAYAMELKKEVEKSLSRPKRNHLVRRLDKARVWAAELARVAASGCCDAQVWKGGC